MGSQHHIDLAKCAFRFVYILPPLTPLSPAALQPAHTHSSRLCFLVKGDRLKCPVQPTAAAPGPRHSSAQKRREGRGLGAPLCRAPPVVFLLFVPIDEGVEVLAVAFV